MQHGGASGIPGHVMLFTNARPVWDPRAANYSARLFADGAASHKRYGHLDAAQYILSMIFH
jgi:hypothetical protein